MIAIALVAVPLFGIAAYCTVSALRDRRERRQRLALLGGLAALLAFLMGLWMLIESVAGFGI